MSTYLQLCRDVERESGAVSPSSLIQNVDGATNRSAKSVAWVRDAWLDIQNRRDDWTFMRRDFSGKALAAGQGRYVPATDWSMTDVSRFERDTPRRRAIWIRDPAAPERDDSPLIEIDYDRWKQDFSRGQQASRPMFWAVSPAGELCVGPFPDKVYHLDGGYRRTAQVLTSNLDVPICREEYHQVIVWKALLRANGHDEATQTALASASTEFVSAYQTLVNNCTPRINLDVEPLA
jgi:hypothetical protein